MPVAFFGAILAIAKTMNTNPPTNSAHTSMSDVVLPAKKYGLLPGIAAPRIAKLRLSTYGRAWKCVGQTQISPDEIQLQFRVPVLVFTDLLTVSLRRQDDATMTVNCESHSQVGQGDFGENRRHVQQMMKAIDGLYSPFPA